MDKIRREEAAALRRKQGEESSGEEESKKDVGEEGKEEEKEPVLVLNVHQNEFHVSQMVRIDSLVRDRNSTIDRLEAAQEERKQRAQEEKLHLSP